MSYEDSKCSVLMTLQNMDDCWAYNRNANGVIQPDPKAFPSGIKALADYGILSVVFLKCR